MIERYTTSKMKFLWSDQNRFQKWLDIEILACEAMAQLGMVPKAAVSKIKKKAKFDVERIAEIEEKTKHDVVAFLTNVAEHVGPESEYIHFGMTSSDILDTSLSLLMKESGEVILQDLEKLSKSLKSRAFEFQHTPMIGRTHGVHAEPITCERLCGLARLVRTNAQASLENITLWHERDISHSSVERVIIPDSTILVDYMLIQFNRIIDNLIVYPENMKRNLNKTGGMIFSGRLLLELSKRTTFKEEAYQVVQDNAMEAWTENKNFKELILNDKRARKYLSEKEIEECFSLDYYLRNVDYIFKRVFK